LALLKGVPQNCSYLAIHKVKAVGNDIALKAQLSQFVPHEPFDGYSNDDKQHVADEC